MNINEELDEAFDKLQDIYYRISDDCQGKDILREVIDLINEMETVWEDAE